ELKSAIRPARQTRTSPPDGLAPIDGLRDGLTFFGERKSMPSSTTAVSARLDTARTNRFLAALPLNDFSLLAPQLRIVELARGAVLHEPGEPIEHVYFPHDGMVSVVTIMRNGGTVETASLGRTGVIGATAALGARHAVGRAIVQLPGTASRLPAPRFHAAAQESHAISDLAVRYNDLLIAQIQQSVACNALHTLEARLCRWLLQTHDCVDGDTIPLTQ